jgi:peptidyl-prolyl cis-trans isomerase C
MSTLHARARQWLREPLLHFLLIGLALFLVQRNLPGGEVGEINRKQIVLTEDDLNRMIIMWRAKGRPAPTQEQMQSLLETKIREEVLYREALALGLDKNDTIVKRRMVQKLEFLAEDLSDLREPYQDELKAWFSKNAGRFTSPGRVAFRHLYFSFDKHGRNTAEAAAEALKQVAGKPADSLEGAKLADAFMFQDYYADRSFDELAKTFGPQFARSLFELKPGSWQGPIESGYGCHLVFMDSLTPGRVPEFEEVEADVKTAWLAEQKAVTWDKAYKEMRAKYSVSVPGPPEDTSMVSRSANARAAGSTSPEGETQ